MLPPPLPLTSEALNTIPTESLNKNAPPQDVVVAVLVKRDVNRPLAVWITDYGAYSRGSNPELRLKYPTSVPSPPLGYRLYLRDDRADAPPSEAEEVDEIVVIPAEDAVSRSDVIEQVRRFAELLEEEHGTLEEFLEEEETY